jgi:RES domain-containing protein
MVVILGYDPLGLQPRQTLLVSSSRIVGSENRNCYFSSRNMAGKPHPDYDEIKQAIQKFARKGRSFSGVYYRCTEPQFAEQIVSGLGSQLHGARWTPKNSFPTVYLCDSVEAALQEYLARARRMRLPDHKSLPMVMAWVKVKAANLLDTTDDEVAEVVNPLLTADKIHWRAIQDRREAVSQAIGRAIHEVCFSGLIAPSQALPGTRNIVIFPKKLRRQEALSAPSLKPLARNIS